MRKGGCCMNAAHMPKRSGMAKKPSNGQAQALPNGRFTSCWQELTRRSVRKSCPKFTWLNFALHRRRCVAEDQSYAYLSSPQIDFALLLLPQRTLLLGRIFSARCNRG